MPFQGGPKAAAQMLSGLSEKEQKKILMLIKKQDPAMALLLEKSLTSIEDLRFCTPKMLVELLREIKIQDLALGLRLSSGELKDYFFKNLPSSLKKEIESVLTGPPVSVSKIEEATSRLMEVVRRKVEKGELVLKKGETLV